MRPYQRDNVIYNEESARERYGFDPPRMADYKALRGDTSDNIPGIPGVGDGTATKLLVQYGSIDGIYAHLDEVKPDKVRENLREHEAPGAPRARDGDDPHRRAGHHPRHGGGARRPLRPPARARPPARPRVPYPRAAPAAGRARAASPASPAARRRRTDGAAPPAIEQQLQPRQHRSRRSMRWSSAYAKSGRFAFDLEGVGQPARTTASSSASPSPCAPGEAYYMPVGHQPRRRSLDAAGNAAPAHAPTWCSTVSRRCSPTRQSRRSRTTASSTSPISPAAASTRPRLRLRHAARRLHPRRGRPRRQRSAPAPAPSASSGWSRAASATR